MAVPPLKQYALPEIDLECMTPEVKALVEFIKEMLHKSDILYAQVVAKEKELEQLREVKKRAKRRRK